MQCYNTNNFPIWKPLLISIFPCFVIYLSSLDSSSTLSLIDRRNPLSTRPNLCFLSPLLTPFPGEEKRSRRESSISTQLELSFPFPSLDSLLSPFPLIQPQTKHEESITERDFTSSLNGNRPTAQLVNSILKEGLRSVTHFPTKFSSTEDFPADWPPTTAIWGSSKLTEVPNWVNASWIIDQLREL